MPTWPVGAQLRLGRNHLEEEETRKLCVAATFLLTRVAQCQGSRGCIWQNKLTKIYATLVLMTHLLRVRGVCQYYFTRVAKKWQWIEKSSFDGVKSNFRVLPVYFCTFLLFCCIPQLCISPTTPPHLKGPLTHSITLALKTYSLFSFEQLVPSCSFGFLWSWFDLYVSSSVISIESKIILCFWWGRDTAML